jgi:hypothetical protein
MIALRYREALAARPRSSADAVLQALDAGTLTSKSFDPSPDPAADLECPVTSEWQKLDTFAPACGYTWTSETAKLPISPQWQACSSVEGIARGSCEELTRHHRIKTFYAGLGDRGGESNKVQIGFVEACTPDQIVLMDADGTIRFALRRNNASNADTTCQAKLLAVNFGQWLAALGGHEVFTKFNTAGHSLGGAFIGGTIGSPPSVLSSSTTDPFHVATSHGSIGPEHWTADGKRRYWNGKSFEKPPRLGWLPVNKDVFWDAKKGFYSAKKSDPVAAVSPGATIREVHLRDKQMVWLEESTSFRDKTCALYATEIDGRDKLTTPRRVTELPCPTSGFVFGCNTVLSGSDTHFSLVSIASGAVRTLRVKGRAIAIDCENAFIERGSSLIRVVLGAFSTPRLQGPPPRP